METNTKIIIYKTKFSCISRIEAVYVKSLKRMAGKTHVDWERNFKTGE